MIYRYGYFTLNRLINDYEYCLPSYLVGVSPNDFSDGDIENFIQDIELITGDTIYFDFSNPPTP